MLVPIYRANIGVTIYELFHLIVTCIVYAWFLYRRKCNLHGIAKFKRLVTFRSEISHSLLKCYSVAKKRSHPSCSREGTPEARIVRKQKAVVCHLTDDVNLDNKEHWPAHIEPKNEMQTLSGIFTSR